MGKINTKIMIGKHMHYVNIEAVLAISRLSWQHTVHNLLNSLLSNSHLPRPILITVSYSLYVFLESMSDYKIFSVLSSCACILSHFSHV